MVEDSSSGDLDARLGKLRKAYRAKLDEELGAITQLVHACESPASATGALPELHKTLHRLAGSAGTFGFQQFGQQARAFEQELRQRLALNSADAQVFQRAEAENWLVCLRQALGMTQSQSSSKAPPANATSIEAESTLVVLIDRDAMLADFLAQQLGRFGFQVVCFQHINQLSDSAAQSAALFLIDHRAGDAAELDQDPVGYWRRHWPNSPSPVVFIGADDNFAVRLNAARYGALGYFPKPLEIPGIAEHLMRLLKQQDQAEGRVLLLSDDKALADQCAALLAADGMIFRRESRLDDLLSVVSEFSPELVLVDFALHDHAGLAIASALLQYEHWPGAPVVGIMDGDGHSGVADAIAVGVDLMLQRPLDRDLLSAICRKKVSRWRQIQEAIMRDGLTGLLQHSMIKEALVTEWRYANRHDRPFSVAMLDIDHFKSVNDSYGHAVGDQVIATLGALLRRQFRSTDKLGRYGGEEFALVLPGCAGERARELLDRFRESFAAIPFLGSSQTFTCTLSAGVVDSANFPDASADELIELADQALYRAKRNGRDQVCMASADE